MHMYKLTRWSGWDYNSGSGSGYQYNSRGFQMVYHNTLNLPISGSNDTYQISSTLHSDVNFYSEDPFTTNANLRNQPQVYLKIFTV